MRYHLTSFRMTTIREREEREKNQKENKIVGKNIEKMEHMWAIGENVNWCSCYGKPQVDQKIRHKTTMSSCNPTSVYTSEGNDGLKEIHILSCLL